MNKKPEPKQPDTANYFPKQAMVVYCTNPERNSQDGVKYYIEVSDVLLDNGKAYLGAGKPVTKATLQTMMDVVAESDKQTYFSVSQIVPTNLLLIDQRAGRNVIAWWVPAKRQTLLKKNKPSVTCWTPPLVYIVKNNVLGVAALNKSKRPTIGQRLHHAPFFNVYNDMRVCLGNVKPPKTSGDIRELMNAWETAFWQSEFTDTVTGAYKQKDLQTWWRRNRRGRFNVKKLKQSTITLKELCAKL